jgi:hypothetical protein
MKFFKNICTIQSFDHVADRKLADFRATLLRISITIHIFTFSREHAILFIASRMLVSICYTSSVQLHGSWAASNIHTLSRLTFANRRAGNDFWSLATCTYLQVEQVVTSGLWLHAPTYTWDS